MGEESFFIDVTALPDDFYGFVQLLFLGSIYGYFLMYASNLISDGSELLLLVPSWAGLIGSVVLPVLGAVPDGCIVLFSGMGPNAQEQLNVGVGALAGSTIMLLTVPWFLSILGGRVNIDPNTKLASYKAPKLTPPNRMDMTGTGVAVSPAVNKGAYIVMLTAVSYFLLQVPGLIYLNNTPAEQAEGEKLWAQLGFVVCLAMFIGYMYQQYQISRADITQKRTREHYLRDAILNRKITLTGVMIAELAEYNLISPHYATGQVSEESQLLGGRRKSTHVGNVEIPNDFIEHLGRILKPFFKIFDEDDNKQLSTQELVAVFREMGENPTPDELARIFAEFDTDKSGSIEYKEFIQGVAKYIVEHRDVRLRHMSRRNRSHSNGSSAEAHKTLMEEAEEEEEDEDMPEDIQGLTPAEQQSKIKLKAGYMMGLGTLIVLIVSDPMVEVLSELGRRTGIPAFYIAFVLAPLASNASELIAAYNYSLKKTPSSISISMATLEGAAVMNNTFVLGIFMLLICTQSLVWEFFAETFSILFVQVVMALYALKKTHTVLDAWIILSLYPLSLAIVAGLEAAGWN